MYVLILFVFIHISPNVSIVLVHKEQACQQLRLFLRIVINQRYGAKQCAKDCFNVVIDTSVVYDNVLMWAYCYKKFNYIG